MADDENTSETALIRDDFLFLGKEVDENGENLTKSAKEIKDYATAELSETVKQHDETIQTLTTAVNSFADVFGDVTKPIEEEKTRAQEEEQKLQSALDTLNADAETQNSVSAKIKTALDDTENRVFSAIQDAKTALEETHSTDKQELSKSIETLSASTNQSVENLATTLGVVQIDLKNEITNRRNAINELSAKIGGGSGSSGLSDLTLQDIITIEMTPEGVVKDDSIFLTELNSEDSHVSAEQIKEYIDAPTNAQFAAESVARQSAEKTLQENIDSEAKRAQDAENTESAKREKVDNDLQSQIDTLNADAEISGSVKNTVSDAIAKVISDAPERLDTLKEIADWIATHENDASAMNSALVEAKNAIIGEAKRAQDAEAVLKESIDSENKERIKAIEEEAKERIEAITALQTQAAEIADNATAAKTTATESAEKVDAMGEKLDAMQETIDAIPFTEDGLKEAVDTANAKIGDWVDISAGAKLGAYSKSIKVAYARYRVISPHIIYLDIQAHIELARTLTTEEDCQLIFFPKLQAICAKDNKIREPYPSVTGYVRGTAAVWNPFVVLESGAINGKIKPNVSISSIDINVQSLFCIMGRDMTKFVLE